MSVLGGVFTYSPLTTVHPLGPSLLRRCQPARSFPLNSAIQSAPRSDTPGAAPNANARASVDAARRLRLLLMRARSRFGEDVLVLAVADDQRTSAVPIADNELDAGKRRIDRDKRD